MAPEHPNVSMKEDSNSKSHGARVALGSFAVLAYFVLFTAGSHMNAQPYRNRLLIDTSVASTLMADATPAQAEGRPTVSAAGRVEPGYFGAFIATMLLFTPINVGFLTLLAGLIGGCASSLHYEHIRTNEEAKKVDLAPESHAFRGESPLASMFRSFLVYVAFMAGVYISIDNPFDRPTVAQYTRFAATLSLFAFVVGYDPTKFRSFLNSIPHAGTKSP
jgi:hypothetical protein